MSLTSIVRRAAQINARGPAVIDGPVRTSWAAFADRVARVAGGLAALGLRPGDRVAILWPSTMRASWNCNTRSCGQAASLFQ